MATNIADNDLTVEYRELDAADVWCVVQRGNIRAADPALGPMLDAARQMARAEGCVAWLVGGPEPTEISALRDDTA